MKTHSFGMHTRYTKAYVLALALTLFASLAMDVEAQRWTKTHAFDCTTLGGTPLDTGYALHNDSPTQDMIALCAIADTNFFPKGSIITLDVHGFDGNTSQSAAAQACRSTLGTTGGGCGPMATTSVTGTGDYMLKPSLQQWTIATINDVGYVWVRIPYKQGSSRSHFRGYVHSEHQLRLTGRDHRLSFPGS